MGSTMDLTDLREADGWADYTYKHHQTNVDPVEPERM